MGTIIKKARSIFGVSISFIKSGSKLSACFDAGTHTHTHTLVRKYRSSVSEPGVIVFTLRS